MPDMTPVEEARARAMLSLRKPENLESLRDYAVPEMGIAVYGVYPAGVGPANVICAYLVNQGRNVTSHTYRSGSRFNKTDVRGRKVLAVKESAYSNGIRQIGDAAQEAIERAYIGPDDFRLLIADTFTLLTPDEIRRSFEERPGHTGEQLGEASRG